VAAFKSAADSVRNLLKRKLNLRELLSFDKIREVKKCGGSNIRLQMLWLAIISWFARTPSTVTRTVEANYSDNLEPVI